jgi:hypothetical protein
VLVGLEDVQSLAEAARWFRDSIQRRVAAGLAGRERVLACFNPQVVGSYVRIYERIAGASAASHSGRAS